MVVHVDGRLLPHDADNTARIYEDKRGLKYVTHEELLECGYREISDFDIVYLNGKFYELQGHVPKADSWWIEEVPIDDELREGSELRTES